MKNYIVFILFLCVVTSSAQTYKGVCGAKGNEKNVRWEITSDNSLIIDGEGKMISLHKDTDKMPWSDYKDKIVRVIIKDGVSNIGAYAFSDFNNLINVYIPSSVTHIGEWCFAYCPNITTICLNVTDPIHFYNPIDILPKYAKSRCALYVPRKAVKRYQQDMFGGKFKTIRAMPSDGTINENAFYPKWENHPSMTHQFHLNVDTIIIDSTIHNVKEKLFCAVEMPQYWMLFCFDKDYNIKPLVFDKEKRTVFSVDCPINPSLKNIALFNRSDSLILMARSSNTPIYYDMEYEEEDSISFFINDEIEHPHDYCFDFISKKWIETGESSDIMYEDNRYSVTYLDFKDYQLASYLVFNDKKTKKLYPYQGAINRLLCLDNTYYIISHNQVDCITKPNKGHQWKEEDWALMYYQNKCSKPNSMVQLKVHQQEVPKSNFIYTPYIITGFGIDKQLYLVICDETGLYIAAYIDGIIHKEFVVSNNNNLQSYESYNTGGEQRSSLHSHDVSCVQLLDYQNNSNVFLSINKSDITLTYIVIQ